MKKIAVMIAVMLCTLTQAEATMKCGAGKCGGAMGASVPKLEGAVSHLKEVEGFQVSVVSKKALIVGMNDFDIGITKGGQPVDAKVKVKFFMPEMPGMPYMDYKDKGKTNKGVFHSKISFSMGGTWQYHIKFKTADEKVYKVKGSVNF
jgi:hypothetical protein